MSDEPTFTDPQHLNQVHIVGRVADDPRGRTLPSGDEIVTVRVVVNRAPPEIDKARRGAVDTVACTAWSADAKQSLVECVSGDMVEIHGSLRRRFWRNASGLNNTYDVEVASADRVVHSYAPS